MIFAFSSLLGTSGRTVCLSPSYTCSAKPCVIHVAKSKIWSKLNFALNSWVFAGKDWIAINCPPSWLDRKQSIIRAQLLHRANEKMLWAWKGQEVRHRPPPASFASFSFFCAVFAIVGRWQVVLVTPKRFGFGSHPGLNLPSILPLTSPLVFIYLGPVPLQAAGLCFSLPPYSYSPKPLLRSPHTTSIQTWAPLVSYSLTTQISFYTSFFPSVPKKEVAFLNPLKTVNSYLLYFLSIELIHFTQHSI